MRIKLNIKVSQLGIDSPYYVKLSEQLDFFLVKNSKAEVMAFQNKCSHMGARINARQSGFTCPVHGWTFSADGTNTDTNELGLRPFSLDITEDGDIYFLQPNDFIPSQSTVKDIPAIKPILTVHSHACLEVKINQQSVLFDPWLVGNAYHGSWKLWPPSKVKPAELRPSAIVLTHPHPDHFHIPTLEQIDRDIPIYFPNFLSGIIPDQLNKLGFNNLYPSNFSEELEILKSIKVMFLKPTSLWEDSSVLLSCDGFTLLNQNDAGAVFDETLLPSNIDVFACAFDQGASGFPLTWKHITESRKRKILQQQKIFNLDRIRDLCKRYDAKYFLPFAGHWRLSYREHSNFANLIPHTSYSEIEEMLQHEETNFLELYPGESFDFDTNELDKDLAIRKLLETEPEPDLSFPKTEPLTLIEVQNFTNQISKLLSLKDLFQIEPVIFLVKVEEDFEVELKINCDSHENTQRVTVNIPRFIAKSIQSGDYNWDHIAIGYFGVWDRNKNVYPTNFMRALQMGNGIDFKKVEGRSFESDDEISGMCISDLVELNPDIVGKIFQRYGLPCLGCHYSLSETLAAAVIRHRLPIGSKMKLVNELRTLM